jgi:hypothetical protein
MPRTDGRVSGFLSVGQVEEAGDLPQVNINKFRAVRNPTHAPATTLKIPGPAPVIRSAASDMTQAPRKVINGLRSRAYIRTSQKLTLAAAPVK